MKILYTGEFKDRGPYEGPVKAASRIFTEISGRETNVKFAGYFQDGKKYGYLKKLFGRETACKFNYSEVELNGLFRLVLTVIGFRPDILHIATFNRFTLPVLFLKQILGFKLVYSLHGFVSDDEINITGKRPFLKFKNRLSEKLFLGMADKIITYSEWSAKELVENYNVEEKKIELCFHGIDDLFFQPKDNVDKNLLRIVSTGSSGRKEKGLQFVMEILQKVTSPFELTVIGNIEGISIPDKLKNKIVVVEPGDEKILANIFRNSELILLGSRKETFSIITLEAMASGVVPFVTEMSGAARFISNMKNGYFLDLKDPDVNRRQIETLAKERTKLESMSKKSADAVNLLIWENASGQYLSLYKNLCNPERLKSE